MEEHFSALHVYYYISHDVIRGPSWFSTFLLRTLSSDLPIPNICPRARLLSSYRSSNCSLSFVRYSASSRTVHVASLSIVLFAVCHWNPCIEAILAIDHFLHSLW